MCRCFSPSRQISAVHFGVQLGLNLNFRNGRLLRGNVDSDRASCCRRKRRELHPLRAIYSAPTTRRNQNSSSNTAEIRNSETAGSLEYGSRFERTRLHRARPASGTATRPSRKTTRFGTDGRVGERGGAPPAVRLRRTSTAALAGFPAKRISPSCKTTLSLPKPEWSKSTGTKAEKWYPN